MKAFLVAAVILAGVSIDVPPAGFQPKVVMDAGVPAVKTIEDHRKVMRATLPIMVRIMSEQHQKAVDIKSVRWAQTNVGTNQDAVVVNFTVAGDPEFSMFFIRKGDNWQVFPDTFSEE